MYDEKNTYFVTAEIMEYDHDTNNLTVRTCHRRTEYDHDTHKLTVKINQRPKNWESVILNCFFSEKDLQNEELINKLNVGTMVVIEGSFVKINKGIKFDIKRIKCLQKNWEGTINSWDNE